MSNQETKRSSTWLFLVVPVLLLAGLVLLFLNTNPIQLASGELPPIENLSIQKVNLPSRGMIELSVLNAGPDPVTISQVLVDDAFWDFTVKPEATLGSLETGRVLIPYPWVETEAHEIVLITPTGATFNAAVELAVETPAPGFDQMAAYALVGLYIGIIPVGLGMLWYPAMRQFSRKLMNFILSLTVGLLVFLLIDTFLEMIEVADQLAGILQGVSVGLFAAVLTWMLIMVIGNRKSVVARDSAEGRKFVALLIAVGIGFHNLGEGLVVGVAFALGESALGSFLVVGFILHNLTEGIGIASPVAKERPSLGWFLLMLLVAGGPAIIGVLIGGFAYSPMLTVIFLGIGVGAIWQVVVEVGRMLDRSATQAGDQLVNLVNIAGLVTGFAIMYLTAFLVKV